MNAQPCSAALCNQLTKSITQKFNDNQQQVNKIQAVKRLTDARKNSRLNKKQAHNRTKKGNFYNNSEASQSQVNT